MNVSCNVIKDLIPLYVEDMASDDSAQLVEEHLETCEDCRSLMNELKQQEDFPADKNAMPLRKIKSSLRKKKVLTIILTFIFTLLVSAIGFAFLTVPNYVPYSEETINVRELADGSVIVEFSEEVSGYDVYSYPSEFHNGDVYDITTWSTTWAENVHPNEIGNVVLNPDGEVVSSVYYYQTDGKLNRLIYGNDEYDNGGAMTLPRLYLSYYLQTAILFAILCSVIILVFRHKKRILRAATIVLFLPLSYIFAHEIVKGPHTASYHADRDFLAMLLITILLYSSFLIGLKLLSLRKERKRYEKIPN